jgi:hypothetical protein
MWVDLKHGRADPQAGMGSALPRRSTPQAQESDPAPHFSTTGKFPARSMGVNPCGHVLSPCLLCTRGHPLDQRDAV